MDNKIIIKKSRALGPSMVNKSICPTCGSEFIYSPMGIYSPITIPHSISDWIKVGKKMGYFTYLFQSIFPPLPPVKPKRGRPKKVSEGGLKVTKVRLVSEEQLREYFNNF